MTVFIPAEIREAMLANAYACHPSESCGLLAGPSAGEIRMAYPLTNILDSHTNYTIDPREHYKALKHAESRGWDIIGVFHSHPHTQARPSPTDVSLAVEPDWLHLLVGMERFNAPVIRGFRIHQSVKEVELEFGLRSPTLVPIQLPTETVPPRPRG